MKICINIFGEQLPVKKRLKSKNLKWPPKPEVMQTLKRIALYHCIGPPQQPTDATVAPRHKGRKIGQVKRKRNAKTTTPTIRPRYGPEIE